MFNSIWIVSKSTMVNLEPLRKVMDFLSKKNKDIYLSQQTIKLLWEEKCNSVKKLDYSKKLDLIIVFWGDWTILRLNSNLQFYDTCVIWVNMWKLWFLSEISPKKAVERLAQIFNWKYNIDPRSLLSVSILSWKKETKLWNVLNEIVISYKNIARIISIKAKIDWKILSNFNSDWLILSTPTWSTAYNISAGWPILYPKIPAFVLTPICSHAFTQKPIVIPDDKTISFEVSSENKESCLLTLDGQTVHTLNIWDIVKINKAKDTFKFIRFPWEHFYKVIKKKLRWGEGL